METPRNNLLPRPLRVLGGKALEHLLNRALALDPDSRERLAGLEGQSVELHLDGPDLGLRVQVRGDKLRVDAPGEAASVRVRTTPGVVIAMALDSHHEVAPGKLEIAGDAGLARQLESLLKDYQPDLEAALSGVLGATTGVPAARYAERAAHDARRHSRQFREDAAAWLRDEARLTPSRAEVDDWLDGVDAVAEAGERLAQRLARLERKQ